MNGLVRNLNDGPLCPNSVGEPMHEAHRLRVRVLDAFYEAADKDEDNEMPEPLERAYSAAAYGRVEDRMDLFAHSTGFLDGNRRVTIEAWWYRCRVCGLVLPANRTAP